MDVVAWIGILSYFMIFIFIIEEYKRNLELEKLDLITHVQRTFDLPV